MTHARISFLFALLLAAPVHAAAPGPDAALAAACQSAEKLMVTGKGDEARALLARAGGAHPDVRVVVLTARSYLCWKPIEPDNAMKVLKPYLAANPHDAEALLEWAHALRESHDYANATKTYDRIIKTSPKELRAYYGKVDVALSEKKFKEAEAAAKAAVAVDANQPESFYYLGRVQERRTDKAGAREAAAAHFLHAVDLAGTNTRYYGPLLFAQMMYEAGDFRTTLDRLRKLAPGDASVAFGEGLELDSQGKLPEAIAKFQGAIAVDPSHTFAHFALGTELTGHSLASMFRNVSSRKLLHFAPMNPSGAYTEYATVRLQDPTFPYMSVIDDYQGRAQSEGNDVPPELKDQQKAWQKYWLLLQLRN